LSFAAEAANIIATTPRRCRPSSGRLPSCDVPIKIRQSKYLTNVVEQDHRAVKRIARPMPGFRSFRCACIILGGIEPMHMIAKGQMKSGGGRHRSVPGQLYDLEK
jgi:putative transposase